MKKNQYIQPNIIVLGINSEGLMASLSKTETETPPGTGDNPGSPDFSGPTSDKDNVPAKEFNNWGTWDWDE